MNAFYRGARFEDTSPDAEERLGAIAEQYIIAVGQGESPDIEEIVRANPDLEGAIREILPALAFAAENGLGTKDNGLSDSSADSIREMGQLGDYRIISEIGRGGMGVVYEATQISLGRHVALKVLPFAAMLDQRAQQRFKNEVAAAAQLDHPNIVDVYAVGCERGVHHYAMRLVHGHTLAFVIEQLKVIRERDLAIPDSISAVAVVGQSLTEANGEAGYSLGNADGGGSDVPTVAAEQIGPRGSSRKPQSVLNATKRNDTVGAAATSTLRTRRQKPSTHHYRSVAEFGATIAEALDHAHEMGVVHRDIKPSNLMIDADGKPWVTDFGLAQVETGATMTMTGDILGTAKYMSPEQVLAKRVVLDHRTDIYSLGVTLYELLTLV